MDGSSRVFSDSSLLGWCILAAAGDQSVKERVEVGESGAAGSGSAEMVAVSTAFTLGVQRYLCRVQRAALRSIASMILYLV